MSSCLRRQNGPQVQSAFTSHSNYCQGELEEAFTIFVSTESFTSIADSLRLYSQLFESDCTPHTYLAEKYVRTGIPAVLKHDESVRKLLGAAFTEFKSEFHEKAGVEMGPEARQAQAGETELCLLSSNGWKACRSSPAWLEEAESSYRAGV